MTTSLTDPFTIRFSSKYTDDESDFNYYGARYYKPSVGGWLNRDPIGENGGMNLYGFVHNNPPNRIDHRGLQDDPFAGVYWGGSFGPDPLDYDRNGNRVYADPMDIYAEQFFNTLGHAAFKDYEAIYGIFFGVTGLATGVTEYGIATTLCGRANWFKNFFLSGLGLYKGSLDLAGLEVPDGYSVPEDIAGTVSDLAEKDWPQFIYDLEGWFHKLWDSINSGQTELGSSSSAVGG